MRTSLIALLSAALLAALPAAALADGSPTKPQKPTNQQGGPPPPAAIAADLCRAEAAKLGKDAFVAKYGSSDTLQSCVEQEVVAVQAAIDSCKSSSGSSPDSMKPCVGKALGLPPPPKPGPGGQNGGQGQNTGHGPGDGQGQNGPQGQRGTPGNGNQPGGRK
ncbi:MAG TPA: hypothetical protein VMB53_05675 [Gaiellaceae bacterium]|nr:hypothetical protein [Gaiellaceae bacterium]